MTQHTPGPRVAFVPLTTPESEALERFTRDIDTGRIAGDRSSYDDLCLVERLARERLTALYAAAPELLTALEAFVATYENIGHGCWPVDKNNPYNILDRARAAIRKATGE